MEEDDEDVEGRLIGPASIDVGDEEYRTSAKNESVVVELII